MMEYSAAYLHIQFLDTPFMFFYYIFNAIMNAQGNTLTPTLISGVSALMNMVLDPLFIFVFHMDVEGAALATVLSKVTMALAGAYVLWRNHGVISLDFHHFRFDKERISRCMKVALPSIIGQSGSSFGFIVLNSFIVSYGTATMAAFGMVNKIFDLVNQPFSSVAGSLTAIVGQNIGANNLQRAKEVFFKVSRIVLIGGSFVACSSCSSCCFFFQSSSCIFNERTTFSCSFCSASSLIPAARFSIDSSFSFCRASSSSSGINSITFIRF